MRRYKFLEQKEIYEALNQLRNAFLAARNGDEVEKIIKGILTTDERLKIGRRILIAEYIKSNIGIDKIRQLMKVGKNTIMHVARLLEENSECFELINRRNKLVENEYKAKKYKKIGGPKIIFKTKYYTGFTRKDVKRQ